jgi:hypothetical protein
MAEKWVTRWRLEVSPAPVLPGVWRLKGGGYVASAQVRDPLRRRVTGQRPHYKTLFSVMRDAATPKEALDWLEAERERIRRTDPLLLEIPLWKDFAVSVFEKKVAGGDIASASGVHGFRSHLKRVIETAAWADLPLDEVRHAHIQQWRDSLPSLRYDRAINIRATGERRVVAKACTYGPRTFNCWLQVTALIWKAAFVHYELPRNPMVGIRKFSTKLAKTYTREEPNSLNPRTEVPEFLARLKARFPRWYAFVLLGFVLGQRPSSLRPLRRRGPHADLHLDKKLLYIRRSHSLGQDIMNTTKTGNELCLSLPDQLIEVLNEHIARLDVHPVARKSDLLFPCWRTGKLLSPNCLRFPFQAIMKEMGLDRKLTSRGMRRTYQDLADEAKLRTVTTMAISGHETLEMKHHYSTAHDDEVRDGLARVYDLATRRKQVTA